jgi:chromate transporter
MIFLKLFLTFFKIGLVSFGGGYSMIALIRDECLAYGWLTEDELLNYIAVAESTPGPIAVNMATFVGASQGGVVGALLATLGVVLPSFVIILIIASVLADLLKYAPVKAVLSGIRPCVIALIIATGATMLLSVLFGIKTLNNQVTFDYSAMMIFAVIFCADLVFLKLKNKKLSPIFLIILSGAIGVLVY